MGKVTIPQPDLSVLDEVLLYGKVGDQSEDGARDFEVLEVIDPAEWEDGQPVISDHMAAVYWMVTVPRSEKAFLREKIKLNLDNRLAKDKKRFVLDDKKLSKAYKDALRGKDVVVEIQDGKKFAIDESWVVEKDFAGQSLVEDVNLVSAGSYDVGSGGDYTTWKAAADDVANLTGNLTFTAISATTETARSLISESLGGYTLTLTSDTPTLGNPNTGYTHTVNHTSQAWYFLNIAGTGTLIFENMRWVRGSSASEPIIRSDNGGTGKTFHIRNNMFDGGGIDNQCIWFVSTTDTHYVYNNIIWDFTSLYMVYTNGATPTFTAANNTLYDGTNRGFYPATGASTMTNNATLTFTSAEYTDIGGSTGNNNASEDTSAANGNWSSGSGNITGISSSDFDSVTDTSNDFLQPAESGNLDGAQTTSPIPGHTTHIDGETLNAIGARSVPDSGITGTGAISATVPTLSGAGTIGVNGTGAIDATVPTLDGSGTVISFIGSGAIDATVPTLVSSGTVIAFVGAGAISATVPTLDGVGVIAIIGSGAIDATVPTLAGTGTVSVTDSVKYLIANDIVGTLKNVKTINGYMYNVPDENVTLARELTEISDPEQPAYFVDVLDTTPINDRGHTTEEWYEYLIRFYNTHDSENPAINYDNRNIEADTIKALKVDVTRGGYAHFTEKGQSGPSIDMDTGAPYQFIHIRCLTTVNASNPYST